MSQPTPSPSALRAAEAIYQHVVGSAGNETWSKQQLAAIIDREMPVAALAEALETALAIAPNAMLLTYWGDKARQALAAIRQPS